MRFAFGESGGGGSAGNASKRVGSYERCSVRHCMMPRTCTVAPVLASHSPALDLHPSLDTIPSTKAQRGAPDSGWAAHNLA